ncbi:MAG: 3-dehydroquinate synthase [Candidatus Hydrogenedens sp.]|jgi:3-dehydroquinate synthase|nr:3-dehydroquinate synthase [Candidatus Hydrogenedens sp.]
MNQTVTVPLRERSYPIHIGQQLFHLVPEALQQASIRGTIGVITDTNVAELYLPRLLTSLEGAGFTCVSHILPAGEESKRLARIEEICGCFLEGRLDRASAIVALGGGVVGDIAGFAAACFMRGIPFIQVPTTIVAQVDSSVGGKTAVNHPAGKNTIGCFHQPRSVIIDMTVLNTLPPRELRAGCAEIIKHGVILDADLFAYMEREAEKILACDLKALEYPVARSCEIKSAIVAEDEQEHGIRALLNFGHTFGHAIETVSRYALFLHGEAVALGMCAAAELGYLLGISDEAFARRLRNCCTAYGLPVVWPDLPVAEALQAMKKDKKARAGTLKFIVPRDFGQVDQRTDITEDMAGRALEALLRPNK